MEKRKLGNSGIEVSPLALGAWAIGGWAWGGADPWDSARAIHACLDHGISTIDTAPIYGFGLSEETIGKAIKGKRDRFQVMTKAGMRWDENRGEFFFTTRDNSGEDRDVYKYSGGKSVVRECEESLRRLGTDYIDLYQIHWPDLTTPVEETMEAMQLLKEQGKIRAIGVSNYPVELLEKASKVVSLTSDQLPYSMVRREIEEQTIPWCIGHSCAIVAYSPLQRGLLTGKITPDYPFAPGDSRPETPYFKINNLLRTNDFLESIKPLAEEKGVTLSQLVIRWTLQRPGITVALVGARNEKQVGQNAGAMEFTLSDEEMDQINGSLEKLELDLG